MNSKEDNSYRLLSQLRPRVRPLELQSFLAQTFRDKICLRRNWNAQRARCKTHWNRTTYPQKAKVVESLPWQELLICELMTIPVATVASILLKVYDQPIIIKEILFGVQGLLSCQANRLNFQLRHPRTTLTNRSPLLWLSQNKETLLIDRQSPSLLILSLVGKSWSTPAAIVQNTEVKG